MVEWICLEVVVMEEITKRLMYKLVGSSKVNLEEKKCLSKMFDDSVEDSKCILYCFIAALCALHPWWLMDLYIQASSTPFSVL